MSNKVCLDVVLDFSLLSCHKTQSYLVDETPEEGISDNCVPFGESVFRQIWGVQRRPLPALLLGAYSSK